MDDYIKLDLDNQKTCVYIGPKHETPVDSYKKIGVVTLKIIDPAQIADYQKQFHNAQLSFPEYQRSLDSPTHRPDGQPLIYVAGGFAAYGNPGSFHNMFARDLIKKAYPIVKDFLSKVIKNKNTKISAIKDRMMLRPAGKQPTAEAWHRDVIGKHIIGGWINLDTKSQYFTFIPGTHVDINPETLDKGFALIPKDQLDNLKKYQHRIEIPPGHIILFPQYIIHTVESYKKNYNQYRLFTGWYLSESDKSLYVDDLGKDYIDNILDNQAVPPLPGGMKPPLFSPNHYNFLFKPFNFGEDIKESLSEWVQNTFKPNIHITKYSKTYDKTYTFIPQHMTSLREYGFPLYPEYSLDEKQLYKPTPLFTLN